LNLSDTAKAELRGKFIAMRAFIKKKKRKKRKTETSKINSLIMHLKLLEKQEQVKPKISRWKEILEIRAEINEMEAKQTIQIINEMKS
jgi:hypothetical protein